MINKLISELTSLSVIRQADREENGMKFIEANEINSRAVMFIKKYGWVKAEEILDSIKIEISFDGRVCDPCFITEAGDYVSCSELEPFVKSYKVVESYGGLEKAKIRCYPAKHATMESYHNLKQAIEDVESCL